MRFISIFCASLLSVNPAMAQDGGFGGELNYAEIADLSGVEIGIGYVARFDQFKLTPMIGAFVLQGELEGFNRESDTICRDLSNGQFSALDNCDATDVEFYGRLDATYAFDQVDVGVGYRFAETNSEPYGIVGLNFSNNSALQARFGEDYASVGLSFFQ